MEYLQTLLAGENYAFIAMVCTAALIIWFLPAILALFFNRKHFKLILLACIPAGLSFIAWGGVFLWAVTGKVVDKYADKPNQA
ncbi:superinfection immunity protein [Shewanella waksmanii]|uniref:superinfection immunity protein n=1 Tax=Shewanella waksmanii TaxID=213783 RepID=UPI003734E2FB